MNACIPFHFCLFYPAWAPSPWNGAAHIGVSLPTSARPVQIEHLSQACAEAVTEDSGFWRVDQSALTIITILNFIWVIVRDFLKPRLSLSSSARPGLPGAPLTAPVSLLILYPSRFFGIHPFQSTAFFRGNGSLRARCMSVLFMSTATILLQRDTISNSIFHCPLRQVQMYSRNSV